MARVQRRSGARVHGTGQHHGVQRAQRRVRRRAERPAAAPDKRPEKSRRARRQVQTEGAGPHLLRQRDRVPHVGAGGKRPMNKSPGVVHALPIDLSIRIESTLG